MRLLTIILSVTMFSYTYSQTKSKHLFAKKLITTNFITLIGGTIIVQAQIDDYSDTLNFVLDTGCGGISLDSATAVELNINTTSTNKVIKGIAGVRKLNFAYNHKLKIKNLITDSLDFHINNYEILTSAYGIKIDGVIGSNFLKRYIVKLDYNINQMDVYEIGIIKYPKRGLLLKPNFEALPCIQATLNDSQKVTSNLIFDIGAGLNTLLVNECITDSSLFHTNTKKYTIQAEGLGGKTMMELCILKEMKIGNYTFKKVPAYIYSNDNNVVNYPKNLGIIGNDILRRFNVILNYPNNEIYLKPNLHFFEDFDYSYTGLSLFQEDDKIKVDDVIPNSPADKAGLKPNDIIFAIENTYNQNLQLFKQLLQSTIGAIKILILRDGEPINILLKPISLNTPNKKAIP